MPPTIIAHRGASGVCPENTIAAFVRAAALGAPMVELDVQLTLDGEVIVLHDDTLDRTTDGRGRASRWTWAAIASLDAGSWFAPAFAGEGVPRLADVLAAVPIGVNVELKPGPDDGLEPRALAAVRDAGALHRVVFSSFDAKRLRRMRDLSADADLAVLVPTTRISRVLPFAEGVGARALHIRKGAAVAEAIRTGHAKGLSVRVWTVNCQEEFSLLVRAGADAVFTDYPDRFLHKLPT